jgi:hypothetical protein
MVTGSIQISARQRVTSGHHTPTVLGIAVEHSRTHADDIGTCKCVAGSQHDTDDVDARGCVASHASHHSAGVTSCASIGTCCCSANNNNNNSNVIARQCTADGARDVTTCCRHASCADADHRRRCDRNAAQCKCHNARTRTAARRRCLVGADDDDDGTASTAATNTTTAVERARFC